MAVADFLLTFRSSLSCYCSTVDRNMHRLLHPACSIFAQTAETLLLSPQSSCSLSSLSLHPVENTFSLFYLSLPLSCYCLVFPRRSSSHFFISYLFFIADGEAFFLLPFLPWICSHDSFLYFEISHHSFSSCGSAVLWDTTCVVSVAISSLIGIKRCQKPPRARFVCDNN